MPNHVAAIASGLGSFALQPAFLEEAAAMAFAAILLDLTIYNIFLFSNDNFEFEIALLLDNTFQTLRNKFWAPVNRHTHR